MRRAAPTAGLSPQLIKHFGIATVTVTALLALFASGEDWGAQAQLEAIEANNRLTAAEAARLGSKRLEAELKIKPRTSRSMDHDAAPDFSMGGGGGAVGGNFYGEPPRPSEINSIPPMGPRGEVQPGQPKRTENRKPTEEEIEAMLEASRQRSGSAGSDD